MPFLKKDNFKASLVIELNENKGNLYLFKKQEERDFLLYKKSSFFIDERDFLLSEKQISHFLKKAILENIIVVLEKDLAFSFLMRATYLRDNFKYPINQPEIERAILRVERQLYEKFRKPALWQLKTDLGRLEFGSVWIDKIFIDDHLVVDPIGFKGKSIGFLLGNTLLDVAFSEKLKTFLNKIYLQQEKAFKQEQKIKIIIIEKEIALTQFLSSLSIFRFIFLRSNENETLLAYIDAFFGSSRFYSLNKGFLDLFIEKISEEFLIDYNSAKKIVSLYTRGGLSQLWQRQIRILEKTAVKIYGDLIYYLLKKVPQWKINPTEKFVFYNDENLWFDLAREIRMFLKTKGDFKTKLRALNFDFEKLKEESNFSLDFEIDIPNKEKIWLISYVYLGELFSKKPMNKYLERAIRRIK